MRIPGIHPKCATGSMGDPRSLNPRDPKPAITPHLKRQGRTPSLAASVPLDISRGDCESWRARPDHRMEGACKVRSREPRLRASPMAALLGFLLLAGASTIEAHGDLLYTTAGIVRYGPRDMRANWMLGVAMGLAMQGEVVRAGFTHTEGTTFLPVNTVVPITLLGIRELVDDQSPTGKGLKGIAALASAVNGIRVGGELPHFSLLVGHHLELLVPGFAVAETLEANAVLYCIELGVFKRYASRPSLSNSGVSLGLAWDFSDPFFRSNP